MSNVKGLAPFPRNWGDDVPRAHLPYLEDIRRAANAVRVLRRRGLPTGAARLRLRDAAQDYEAFLDREQRRFDNPGLF